MNLTVLGTLSTLLSLSSNLLACTSQGKTVVHIVDPAKELRFGNGIPPKPTVELYNPSKDLEFTYLLEFFLCRDQKLYVAIRSRQRFICGGTDCMYHLAAPENEVMLSSPLPLLDAEFIPSTNDKRLFLFCQREAADRVSFLTSAQLLFLARTRSKVVLASLQYDWTLFPIGQFQGGDAGEGGASVGPRIAHPVQSFFTRRFCPASNKCFERQINAFYFASTQNTLEAVDSTQPNFASLSTDFDIIKFGLFSYTADQQLIDETTFIIRKPNTELYLYLSVDKFGYPSLTEEYAIPTTNITIFYQQPALKTFSQPTNGNTALPKDIRDQIYADERFFVIERRDGGLVRLKLAFERGVYLAFLKTDTGFKAVATKLRLDLPNILNFDLHMHVPPSTVPTRPDTLRSSIGPSQNACSDL